MTERQHQEQIESWLERPLLPNEADPVDSLKSLSESQLQVARHLARNNSLVCILYLRMIVPGLLMNEAREYTLDVLQAAGEQE